ncbi:MAG: radical SAM protein [Chitinispirillaceae bacterium]|nr:radical SAM protein [Chitinispirillaceae bacterium]
MKPRLRALLLHGMGNGPSWWDPFMPLLRELGVTACALTLPDLETHGPQAWVDTVGQHHGSSPTVLIGHSLGAAAALRAAVTYRVCSVIAIAMPASAQTSVPAIPPSVAFSATALARIALFIREVSELSLPEYVIDRVCLIGEHDSWVDEAALEGRGFRRVVAKNTGHEVNESFEGREALAKCIAGLSVAAAALDPAVRLLTTAAGVALDELGLGPAAPPPARLDLEITSRCQLRCKYCARTLYGRDRGGGDMTPALFIKALDSCAIRGEVVFVGLGEPLLHPGCAGFVARAHARGARTWMVTNGLAADAEMLLRLRDAGLDELTFSVDAAKEELFARLRDGASLEKVKEHIAAACHLVSTSLFTTLSRENVEGLSALIDLAGSFGLPALTVTDLNFPENRHNACAAAPEALSIDSAVRRARESGILLLGPHIHDFSSVKAGLRYCLVNSHDDIIRRSTRHTHCLAPWRIAVVDAQGNVTPCNCAPDTVAGNIMQQSFDTIWNGEIMREWRTAMCDNRNERCRSCPRY